MSLDESLLCFYSTKEYIAVFDVESRDLRWYRRLKGDAVNDYWMSKLVFHPTKPMMAWIEQYGKNHNEDFSLLKDCGVYISDVSHPNDLPARLEGFTGKSTNLPSF